MSRTGFVRGVALGDWESTTPDRHQSNGRGGRTPEGLDVSSRHQTSSSRRDSQNRGGVARPAQNPFAFVSFDYSQLDRRKGGATSSAVVSLQHNKPLPEEMGAVASGDREVVVPAVEGRVEVYMDRKGSLEPLDALDFETRTTGLGFVDQEPADCTNHMFEAEKSGNIADSELNSVGDRNVAALEAMKVGTDQDNYLHLKTSVDDKNFRSTPRNKKNRRGSCFEIPLEKENNAGYLRIGGVKVFTEAGITVSDESEDLGEESDVCLELDFASGKKRRDKGIKRFTSKDKESLRASGVHQRGQWLEDTFSGSGESIVDSSDSDIDDDVVADYMANVEGAEEMLDDTWLLKNKLQHVAVEDMGSEDWEDEDEDEDNTSTDASGSDDDSSDSACTSPETIWSLKRQRKGKELMDIDGGDDYDDDDDLDSELEDMAEKMLFGGSDLRHGRKTKTASLLRNLELEDSEDDTEDECGVDQLFDLMEDANFMPDKVPNIRGTGKQTSGSIGKSIDPAAWPLSVHKSKKKTKRAPGEKKRERKKTIAAKRQERALRRGLDLQAINSALEGIVSRGTDIYAFAPMEDWDRAQIHRMAAIYRLQSGSQGTGKKRFTVVTRTKHTSLPTGADKYRLAAMLDQGDGHSSRALTGEDRRMAKKLNKAARQAYISMQTPTPKRNGKKHQKLMQGEGFMKLKSKKGPSGQNSAEKSGGKKLRTPKYANNPMSFISSGIIGNEEEPAALGLGASACVSTVIATFSTSDRGEASTSRSTTIVKTKVTTTMPAAIGTFEAHTTGFGSRMMSKMGFVEGQGLGRDRQGICSPLEAVKRAKNLGLGAYAPPPPT